MSDRMLLSPWQKWLKYNRFPWRICLHALLFAVVLTQVMLNYVESAKYLRATHNTFGFLFLNATDEDTPLDYIYSRDEVLQRLAICVNNYYSLNIKSVDRFVYSEERHQPHNITMEVHSYKKKWFKNGVNSTSWDIDIDNNLDKITEKFVLTVEKPYGPYDPSDREKSQSYWERLIHFDIHIRLINVEVGNLGAVPIYWEIDISYHKRGGQLAAYLNMGHEVYYTEELGFTDLESQKLLTAFNCIVFILSLMSLIWSVRGFLKQVRYYLMTKRQYKAIPEKTKIQEKYPRWKDIRLSVKFEFFNLWVWFMIITSVCLVLGSILGITQEFGSGHGYGSVGAIFQALGAFGITCNLTRYLEYYKHFFTLILTLKLSFINILRFMISAFPIFFGYVLMGVILFAPYSYKFSDIMNVAITLFSLLNGDAIRDTFRQISISYPYPAVPIIYLFTFIGLFITAILNIFIFIIEDAFHSAKISKQNQRNFGKDGEGESVSNKRHKDDEEEEEFDIFALFDILEREYNIEEDSDSSSSDVSSIEIVGGGVRSRRETVVSGRDSALELIGDYHPVDLEAGPDFPDDFSIDSLRFPPDFAAGSIVQRTVMGEEMDQMAQLATESISFEFKIVYKKLKNDISQIISNELNQFELSLDKQVRLIKTEYREHLQKKAMLALKASFQEFEQTKDLMSLSVTPVSLLKKYKHHRLLDPHEDGTDRDPYRSDRGRGYHSAFEM
eukprot:CAMPEP_0174272706 /NCGR_PEP_ID=MMETSP0439-20130205/52207_1 /TAXON_ID=0 /ORGANISM="Stereomyxa ramosa, Strain Chinc5" /LENGTH=726 /DNA_ID=CAMNT_0015363449 /DNA_START=236 /DNA_END=2416 /DNA_ORIENTATION=+